ncbi:hypothetical protein MATL_G00182360 [Megalops atlanticus]|uniref:T-cell-specific surface glycoprotein CD28 n=1 Tax=Megalops atlanticus TaxID=7932 RepID=A0A9D3PNB3_MEGAT|nr:hypothetical protein MATL_G00182360 [Megalops atlanticus]
MNASWPTPLLLVFSLVFAAGNNEHSLSCTDKNVPVQRVQPNASGTVPCPYVSGDEMTFRLNRCGKIISTININKTNSNNMTCPGVDFQMDWVNNSKAARFLLSQLKANSSALYNCEAEVLYPPPYRTSHGQEVMISVEELRCPPQEPNVCPPDNASMVISLWIWVAACSVLFIYSTVITAISGALWKKLRNKQYLQQDYINMKPRYINRLFKRHQGVQHPDRVGRY